MQFGLKALLKFMTIGCVLVGIAQSAGYWVTLSLFQCVWLLRWSMRSRRRGFLLFVRTSTGFLSLVAIWFLSIDWYWFVWLCNDCSSYAEIAQFRVFGVPIRTETQRQDSFFNTALSDLAVPCRHEDSGTSHSHRWWGGTVCDCPRIGCMYGYYSSDERYTATIAARLRQRGLQDPDFAREVYRQIISKHNRAYFWDGLMADEMVVDSINANRAHEALKWLDERVYLPAGFSDEITAEEQLRKRVCDFYNAGAEQVIVVNPKYHQALKIGDSYIREYDCSFELFTYRFCKRSTVEQVFLADAEYIAIELPTQAEERERVFAWEAEYQVTKKSDPTPDYGQSYLLLDVY